MKKTFARLLALILLVGSGFLITAVPASASTHDAHIKNYRTSDRWLQICENWGATTCTTASQRENYRISQGTRTVNPDVDGFYNPAGCDAWVDSIFTPVVVYRSTGWKKLRGLNGGTWTVDLRC